MELWEGNVFTPECHSVILFIWEGVSQHAIGRSVCIPTSNGWRVCIPTCNGGDFWPLGLGDVQSLVRYPLLDRPLWADTLLGRHPSTPEIAIETGTTYPIGMN